MFAISPHYSHCFGCWRQKWELTCFPPSLNWTTTDEPLFFHLAHSRAARAEKQRTPKTLQPTTHVASESDVRQEHATFPSGPAALRPFACFDVIASESCCDRQRQAWTWQNGEWNSAGPCRASASSWTPQPALDPVGIGFYGVLAAS